MPGMSGVDLSRELQSRTPALKVLFFSGYPGRHTQAATQSPGAEYLSKPVSPTELLTRIDQLLGST
jgi:YesN/AraC family two-component response regulator